ncbi:MAG TPA: LON peptidase substrate-binding domain-containing protein [Dehalococcoidia bacterium]|jgi:Lon protease-like protein|nr:LON peptidase substrate-binding domain-containing protein [Dehalococcoidia bacterium]
MFLRLFPLQSVLFPGMRMPLHIFEDRYKTMIRECIEEDAPFGVLLIRVGAEVGGAAVPYGIGTTARINQVEYLDDGRMNIFAIGERRFRVVTLDTSHDYLAGEIEYVESESVSDDAAALMPQARDLFNEYFRTYLALADQWTRGVALPDDPGDAADYIAARTDASAQLKQAWLEELSPEARLRHQLESIAEAIPDMRLRLEVKLRQKTSGFSVLN